MTSGDFVWNEKELEDAFTSKTKAILINTPNNPLGKVFTKQELEKIAELCIKHNVLVLADEGISYVVYYCFYKLQNF